MKIKKLTKVYAVLVLTIILILNVIPAFAAEPKPEEEEMVQEEGILLEEELEEEEPEEEPEDEASISISGDWTIITNGSYTLQIKTTASSSADNLVVTQYSDPSMSDWYMVDGVSSTYFPGYFDFQVSSAPTQVTTEYASVNWTNSAHTTGTINVSDFATISFIWGTQNPVSINITTPPPTVPSGSGAGVKSYLPAPGQFTNEGMGTGGWGDAYTSSGSLKSMKNATVSTGVSLGYFGGYVVYDFSTDPITNSNTHPGGIDFVVYGNAFTNNSEPGCIQVSPDGDEWFDIAGSWHYEPTTDWDYTITYEKPDPDGNQVDVDYTYTGDLGNGTGTVTTNTFHNHPWYPQYANYDLSRTINGQPCPAIHGAKASDSATVGYPFAVYNTNNNTLKLSGVNLGGITGNDSASGAFGYCDVTQGGDGIDLAWTVYPGGHALEGQPVADSVLQNGISYVRIYTGTALSLGMLGEMSTEVTGIQAASSGSTVSYTSVPDLLVWGESIFEEIDNTPERACIGGEVYDASEEGIEDISVSATIPSNTTVYINNKKLTSTDNTYYVNSGTKYIRVYAKESGKAGRSVWYRLFSNEE